MHSELNSLVFLAVSWYKDKLTAKTMLFYSMKLSIEKVSSVAVCIYWFYIIFVQIASYFTISPRKRVDADEHAGLPFARRDQTPQ